MHFFQCVSPSPSQDTVFLSVTCRASKAISFEIPDLNQWQWDLCTVTLPSLMKLSSFTNTMCTVWRWGKRVGMSILESVSASPGQGYNSFWQWVWVTQTPSHKATESGARGMGTNRAPSAFRGLRVHSAVQGQWKRGQHSKNGASSGSICFWEGDSGRKVGNGKGIWEPSL